MSMERVVIVWLLVSLCAGCDPVTAGVSAGAGLAATSLFGDSKLTREAREAYVRAPSCSAMPRGIPNGRIEMRVGDIGWYSYYPMPDGSSLTPERDKGLVAVEYEIANRGPQDVLVNPPRALLTDAKGNVTQERAGSGGLRNGKNSLEDDGLLRGGETWRMVSVFELPPGEYALLAPSGRMTDERNPRWLAGCRFPGPTG
jgi:hypothetical protein